MLIKRWVQFSRGFLFAGFLVGALDSVFLLVSRKMFFDSGELFRAVLFTLGMDAVSGLVLGITVFGLHAVFSRIYDAAGWRESLVWKTVTAGCLLFGPAVFGWLKLFSGPQASQLRGRVLIAVVLGAVCAFGVGLVLSAVPKWSAKNDMRRRVLLFMAVFVAIGATLVDAWILVRLYPLFHYVLTLSVFLAAGIGFTFGLGRPSSTSAGRIYTGLSVLILGFGGYSFVGVSQTQNIRFVIGYVTPAASDGAALLKLFRFAKTDESGEGGDIEAVKSAGNALSLPGADVFLITVDAMRYDRLMSGGGKRSVAPNLDRFAETAVRFERAYTAIPHTSYALTSLLTGKYTHSLFDVPGAPPVHETWPEVMKRFRYDTAAFFTPAIFFIDRARFEPYFRAGFGFSYRKVEAAHTAEERTAALLAYLKEKKNSGRPLFSWIHYFEPHEPYDAACTHFGSSPEERYDCEIWTVDKAVGELLQTIDASYPNAVVIVSADHGEEFGDHGGNYHGTTLFDEQVRVPLLMRIPGVSSRQVAAPVSLVDLMGTVLRVVDIPIPARIRSRDLTGVILDGETNIDAFAEAHDDAMLVYDGYKLICSLASDLCRLYDLAKDPKESRSVAEQHPQKTEELKKRLSAWRRSHARYELRPVSMDENGEKWPDAVKRALGGDMTVLDDLLAVVSTSNEGAIRRKAAELAFRLAEEMPKNVPLQTDEPDVEVAAWLRALLAKFGDKDAVERLRKSAEILDPRCEAFRAVALVRAAGGDNDAYDDLLTIALDDAAMIETRKQALKRIASMERHASADRLISLINNYQLTLDAAETLGALKIKAAVDPLSVRLKRERFLERKAALVDALSEIGDWRAVAAVSDELYNEIPPPGILLALSRMTELSPFGRRLPSDTKGRETVYYRPAPENGIQVFLKGIRRVVIRVTAAADGGAVVVSCGGTDNGRIPLTTGSAEGFVDIEGCEKKPGKPYALGFRIEAALNQATVDMVAVLGK